LDKWIIFKVFALVVKGLGCVEQGWKEEGEMRVSKMNRVVFFKINLKVLVVD